MARHLRFGGAIPFIFVAMVTTLALGIILAAKPSLLAPIGGAYLFYVPGSLALNAVFLLATIFIGKKVCKAIAAGWKSLMSDDPNFEFTWHGTRIISAEEVEQQPDVYLVTLCTPWQEGKRHIQASLPISLKSKDGSLEKGIDGGGLSAQLWGDLINKLKEKYFTKLKNGLYAPQSFAKGHKDPDALFYRLGTWEKDCYKALGTLCAVALARPGFVTGRFCDDALFKAVLMLIEEHSEALANASLDEELGIKICAVLIDGYEESGILKNSSYLKKALSSEKDARTYLGFKGEDVSLTPRLQVWGLLDQVDPQIPCGILGQQIEAVFCIAQGMYGALKRSEIDIQRLVVNAEEELEEDASYIQVSLQIQGHPIDDRVRGYIVQALVHEEDLNNFDHLTTWIEEDASLEEIQQFLRFVTGASFLVEGASIKVSSHSTNNGLPKAHTCFDTIELPPNEMDYDTFVDKLTKALPCASFDLA